MKEEKFYQDKINEVLDTNEITYNPPDRTDENQKVLNAFKKKKNKNGKRFNFKSAIISVCVVVFCLVATILAINFGGTTSSPDGNKHFSASDVHTGLENSMPTPNEPSYNFGLGEQNVYENQSVTFTKVEVCSTLEIDGELIYSNFICIYGYFDLSNGTLDTSNIWLKSSMLKEQIKPKFNQLLTIKMSQDTLLDATEDRLNGELCLVFELTDDEFTNLISNSESALSTLIWSASNITPDTLYGCKFNEITFK